MHYQLAAGVNLHVIPTNKFTTTRILINFATKQTSNNASSRNLLVNVMANGSMKYPDQVAIARELNQLYGAEFDAYVNRLGLIHNVRFSLSIVNNNFTDFSLSSKAVNFLHDIIYHPQIVGSKMAPHTWKLQQANLIATLKSWSDDPQYEAVVGLLEHYFKNNSPIRIPAFGNVEQIRQATNQQLLDTYQTMIDNDQIDIFVEGNVDPQEYLALFKQWKFLSRSKITSKQVYYEQSLQRRRSFQAIKKVEQAKLDLAYHFPVYFNNKDYYSAVVMNGLFGATPYSLLFKNVREAASLAYYANSSYQPFGGYLLVQTGIDGADYQRVLALINDQLAILQNGDFVDQQLEQVKKNLINGYLMDRDNPGHLTSREFVQSLTHDFTPRNSIDQIKNVSRQDIVDVSQKISLQTVYFLNRSDTHVK